MAVLAHRRGLDVRAVLAGRGGTVVTACAVAGHIGMIKGRRNPAIGGMTVIAVVVTGNVVGRLAQCRGAVVTAEAGAQYRGMINPGHRVPGRRRMAVLAHRRGLDVRAVLAGRGGTVVTACAVAGHIGMIKGRRCPAIGGMTIIAVVVTGNVVGRLAQCRGAVVTAEAGAQYRGMIDPDHRVPGRRRMAVLAHRRALDVRAVLTGRGGTVVTACAVAGHRAVIEGRRCPAIGGMTVIAVVVTGNVVGRLAQCRAAIVTAEAGAQYRGMINPGHRVPGRRRMAVLAHRRGLDVSAVLAGRGGTVVTACAVAGHRAVIEGRRHPAIGGMTIIAVVVTGNVVGRLAQCRAAIVTAEAGAQYRGMINPGHRGPDTGIGAVTVLALVRGLDVSAVLAGRGGAIMTA